MQRLHASSKRTAATEARASDSQASSSPDSQSVRRARNHCREGSAVHSPPWLGCALLRLLPLRGRKGAVRVPPFFLLVPDRPLRDSHRCLHPPRYTCFGRCFVPFGGPKSASSLVIQQRCHLQRPRQGCNLSSHKGPRSVPGDDGQRHRQLPLEKRLHRHTFARSIHHAPE